MQVTSDYNYTIIARLVQFVDYIAELFKELATPSPPSSSLPFLLVRIVNRGELSLPSLREKNKHLLGDIRVTPIEMINHDHGIASTRSLTLSSLLTFIPFLFLLAKATLVVSCSRIKLAGFLPSFLISTAET